MGFFGLGVMGKWMADHLLRSGFDLMVFNRTKEKMDELVTKGAKRAESAEELASRCEMVFLCVSKTEDVWECVEKILPALKEGSLIVDHSTIEPKGAQQIFERCKERGVGFLDAPVTGGEKGAMEGTLTIFCGGMKEDFEKALPFMQAYSKTARLVGNSGSGQMMKMANQIAVSLTVLSMAECLAFCEKVGLDINETIDLIGGGAGGSWSLSHYGPKVVARDYRPGFSVALQQKDLRYALDTAREKGLELRGVKLVHELFSVLEREGRENEATPALFDVVRESGE